MVGFRVCCRKSLRSLRELFLIMVILACFSTLVTYQIGMYLPWTGIQADNGQVKIINVPKENKAHDTAPVVRQHSNQHNLNNHRRLSQASRSAHVLSKLLQIEERLLTLAKPQRAVVIGSNHSIVQQVSDLQTAFQINDVVMVTNPDNHDGHHGEEKGSSDWSLVWCTDSNYCVGKQQKIHHYTKINQIAELKETLLQPVSLCKLHSTLTMLRDTTANEQMVSCHIWPYKNIQRKVMNNNGKFVILSSQSNVTITSQLSQHTLLAPGEVVWHFPVGVLSVQGLPVVLHLPVLVSSLSPLRLYLHSAAAVSQHEQKIPTSIWMLRRKVSDEYGQKTARIWWKNLQQSVVSVVLAKESVAYQNSSAGNCGCPRCFQLLTFDLIFTPGFEAVVIRVRYGDFVSEVIHDTITMMSSIETVAMDVATALDEVGQDVFTNDQDCSYGYGICLTNSDLVYSLDNKREKLAPVSFLKLYPTDSSNEYTSIVNKLRQKSFKLRTQPLHNIMNQPLSTNEKELQCHMTSDLHSVLVSIEQKYSSSQGQYRKLTNRSGQEDMDNNRPTEAAPKKLWPLFDMNIEEHICSKDPKDMPYLTSIHTEPDLHLAPTFDPSQYTYTAEVDYDIFLIKIWSVARNCKCEARIDYTYGTAGVTNYTLGVGENTVRIAVVAITHPDPWVVNTYTITIRRHMAEFHLPRYSPAIPLITCSLKQDCSLQFSPLEPCGLHPVTTDGLLWTNFLWKTQSLPFCTDTETSAQWYVPCSSCQDRHSCYWQQAVWRAQDCSYRALGVTEAQRCLAGRKLLFIGDSTNRGILHYIMEKVNGSLMEWDKTHNLKLYSNINGNKTLLSFAYYPQFWLPTNHRPAFDKAVFQLIKSTLPLENNSNTVLVVGGVHWLGKQHLSLIHKALQREKLTGIQLVMKGLGAGFHQLVEGVRFAPMEEQRRLALHEQMMSEYGRNNGFSVVETFNMTMARYKDFLQGKCACHFHKVTQQDWSTSAELDITYHVEGDINALYSELVLSHICKHRAPD